jgi:Flp pilus assembly protein TadG
MTRLFARLAAALSRLVPDALRREDGTATMEFVLVVPLIMAIFMASFESGLLMTRSILLEQSVDMTMRELRLGHYPKATNFVLKKEICSRTVVFADCVSNMKIELERVSTTAWDMPAAPVKCINRQDNIDPVVTPDAGQQNDLMLIRVCVVLQAMFPSTGLGLKLPLDKEGGYGLIARSAFVVEPS